MEKFEITFSGRFHYRKGSGIVMHSHPDYQIQMVYSGEGINNIDDVSYTMSPGDIYLIKKGSRHSYSVTSSEGMKTLEVKFVTLDESLTKLLASGNQKIEDQERQIFNLFSRIVLEGQKKSLHYKEMSESLLREALILMERISIQNKLSTFEMNTAEHPNSRKENSQVITVVDDYIAKNINRKFSLKEMADDCGYNQDYLYRVIKRETGLSAVSYINHIRFEQSKLLIQHTELTLTEIAWNLGFENIQYFTRFFKKHSGISPSQYLKNVRDTVRTDY